MIRVLLTLALALSLTAVSACQSNKTETPNKPANNGPTNAAATAANPAGEQKVTINSPDGVRLVGTFFVADKPNSPAVLLLHQWQSDRHSYDDFAKRIQGSGFAVLSMDGRGFGESTRAADGMTVPEERTDAAVKAMLGDVHAAFDFLSKQNNVNPNKIGILGASYGSSLALLYAADVNTQVAAVVMLSPGLNYFGNMATGPAIQKCGERPIMLIAAEDDLESAKAVGELGKLGNTKTIITKVYPAGGHGTALLNSQGNNVSDAIFSFLTTRLGSRVV